MVQRSFIRNVSLIVATTFILSGCANMPQESLGLGALRAVACGLGVALFGGNGSDIAKAAAICGTIEIIGEQLLKNRREKYASAEEFYNGEIKEVQLFNTEKEHYKTQLVAEVHQLKVETQKMLSLQKNGQTDQQALKNQKIVLQKKQEEVDKVAKNMKDELKFQQALHAKIKKEKPKDSRLANLEKEVNKLNQTIAEVEKQRSQLASLDDDLV